MATDLSYSAGLQPRELRPRCLAFFPNDIDKAAFSGALAPSDLSADEKVPYERLQFVYQKRIAYGFQMGLRPQTLYRIADSPVGLAGYFSLITTRAAWS
jgi:hypothetical protein